MADDQGCDKQRDAAENGSFGRKEGNVPEGSLERLNV
jgi:hypothetical protein